ncbi:LPXTG cell wall anchor domain-containing protein [Streptomyces tropicalis]|uniref:LPXTG cell wall anchor domain-containing protein n=1 Tax=Streptomyces tropicalis TaxID=3034234 RepID=A0ABT5ZYW9_9ACTN|nr:LPXTG cell wall anchor domain-containing protein [Streptomyces tropicalis]MDF3297585.1 LPXTG cell wall anchor domain-containing protein [Streptomyces tropicalis]
MSMPSGCMSAEPVPAGGHSESHHAPPQLSRTGSQALIATSAAGAVLIALGTVLYRRGRASFLR